MTETNGYTAAADLLTPLPRRYVEHKSQVGTTLLQSLTELERSKFEAWYQVKGNSPLGKVKLITLCAVGADKKRFLDDEHMPQLLDQDAAITGGLFDACAKLCGFADEDADEIEARAKN
jgi:hypothetical protein